MREALNIKTLLICKTNQESFCCKRDGLPLSNSVILNEVKNLNGKARERNPPVMLTHDSPL